MLHRNEIATEYFRLLNPIEHARTKEDALKYKSEPYVIVADVYSHPNLIGRGGWSWYTGSASWYFIAGVKYILGLRRKGDYLEIKPNIPNFWNNCHMIYQIEGTEYRINVVRNHVKEEEREESKHEQMVYLDNELIEGNQIKICLDDKTHIVDIKIKN